jgi:hypothetical protein
MAIDPSIPLGVRLPQSIDVTRGFEQGARMARLAAITQQEQAEAERLAKAEATKARVTSVLSKYQGDMGSALPEIYAIDPEVGMKIQQTWNSSKESDYKLKTAKLSHDRIIAEEIGRKAQAVTDQESYGYFLADLKASGLPTDGMPPTYNPAYVDGLKTKSLTVLENANLEEKRLQAQYNKWKAEQELRDKEADNQRQAERDAEIARHNRVMERKPTGTDNALVAIVGPDGKPVYVPRSQAVGKTPASTRESGGGRGVTSGDANRLADFDTSLDDVTVLRKTVSGNKSTGTRAAVGAALPNFVTEATGIGQSAKEKQAVIDRVKQVIGKALEGGVLRKEDEYKYTKILPTISDTPETVKAKLDGLESALKHRKDRLLDSLDDAGYNTESYRSRAPKPAQTGGSGEKKVGRFTVREK